MLALFALAFIARDTSRTSLRPCYLLAFEGPTTADAHRNSVACYRVDATKPLARRLVQVEKVLDAFHRMEGSLRLIPEPAGPRIARFMRSEDGNMGWLDVWSVRPLARAASIRLVGPRRVDWLAGRDVLAVVEATSDGYRTRVVDARGKSLLKLERSLGVIAASGAGRAYAIRYSPSLLSSDLDSILRSYPPYGRLAKALTKGEVWFEALDEGSRGARRLGTAEAVRAMFGRSATLTSLASLVDPQRRPLGFAGHWLLPATEQRGYAYGSMKRVVDTIASAKGSVSFVRREREDGNWDDVHSVAPDGSLLYSGDGATDDAELTPEEGTVAVRIGPDGKRQVWRLPAVKNARTVVIWGK